MDVLQAQKVTDFRQRILENVKAGRGSYDGIPAEDIRACLDILRQNRVVGASRGGETTAKARKSAAAKKAEGKVDQSKLAALGDFD